MTVTASRRSGSQAPADVAFVTGRLRPYLTDVLAGQQEAWKKRGVLCQTVPHALAAYTGNGKALRPRFCYWGHAIVAGKPGRVLLQACAALEFLHAFALIHDDLMDQSATRRGRPALHRQFAAQHREWGWAGDPDAYGNAVALLTGDAAFALASRLAATLPAAARTVWDGVIDDMISGQFLDLAGAARQDRSPGIARTTTVLKSARYTVTGPLWLGAAVAGADGLPAGLDQYGDLIGEAFQLRDDLLGVFGDPRQTGKPVGEDLQAGKPTQLIAYAAAVLPPRGRALLARAGSGDLTGQEVAELADQIVRCGARDRVERRIDGNVRAARHLVDHADLPPHVAAALHGLAAAATDRHG